MKKKSRIILGIHGLGNKPSREVMEKFWKREINEGLKLNNLQETDFDFELIFWADILHPVPLEIEEPDDGISSVSGKYSSEKYTEGNEIPTFRQKAAEYLEKYYNKILVNGVLSLKYPNLTKLFIHLNLKDLEMYFSQESIPLEGKEIPVRNAIIMRLLDVLNKHKGRKILLVSHSMGSIIVHDALTEYKPGIEIDTYITIGSPLGQKYVINEYRRENREKSLNKLRVPEEIINQWYNLSDLEDQVAFNHEISEFYEMNSRGVRIQDKLVDNMFIYEGTRNPHKSFGYLRTPEFSQIISDFLIKRPEGLMERIIKIFRPGKSSK